MSGQTSASVTINIADSDNTEIEMMGLKPGWQQFFYPYDSIAISVSTNDVLVRNPSSYHVTKGGVPELSAAGAWILKSGESYIIKANYPPGM